MGKMFKQLAEFLGFCPECYKLLKNEYDSVGEREISLPMLNIFSEETPTISFQMQKLKRAYCKCGWERVYD